MTILVGYPTNRRAKVLSLAGMLARSSGEDVVVCTTRASTSRVKGRLGVGERNLRDARADGVHIAYAADATLATLRVVR